MSKKNIPSKKILPAKEKKEEKSSQLVAALYFLPTEQILRGFFDKVRDSLSDYKGEHIYVVIKSIGGDAYTAHRIMRLIRTKFEKITFVIKDFCYSSATLMSLGADEILVSPEGYIGPIDKPLEHDSGDMISALDVTQCVTSIHSLTSICAKNAYSDIRNEFTDTISKKDALEISWKSAVDLMSPVIQKIDPILLQKAHRDLRIGMLIGLELMKPHTPSLKKRLVVVSRLVNNYPSHGYAIFREEMRAIGLNANPLEKCDHEKHLMMHYNKPMGEVFALKNIYAAK